jgi:cytochrome c-type biogenesis protein CcmE
MPPRWPGSTPRRVNSDWKADVTRKGRRLALIGTAGSVLALALALVLFALRDNIVFFYGPTELVQKAVAPGTRMRVGGLVEKGSLVRSPAGQVSFAVTDMKSSVAVTYTGQLPDLFREGQGVVAEGVLQRPGVFAADTVLAKHDETYMPKEVADKLKQQGVWRGDEKAASAAPAHPSGSVQ